MLRVKLLAYDSQSDPAWSEHEPIEVEYVSLFDAGTHGPPALIAPGRQDGRPVSPVARPGDQVLYINTSIVPGYIAERVD